MLTTQAAAVTHAIAVETVMTAFRILRPDLAPAQLWHEASQRAMTSRTIQPLDLLDAWRQDIVAGRPLPWEADAGPASASRAPQP